jgi:hypothetical protein
LGTLLRTTREMLERGARQGRERLDEVLATRRRGDALAELGEIVLDLVRRGEIDVAELPEARDIIAHLDELDQTADGEHDLDDGRSTAAPSRRRFDDRSTPAPDGTVSSKAWTPPPRSERNTVQVPMRPKAERASGAIPAISRRDPARGGIAFDDDDDLADYMNPADVPPKPRPDDES